jgi:hypothetical protein
MYDKTKGDDEAYCILELKNGAVALLKTVGDDVMDDRISLWIGRRDLPQSAHGQRTSTIAKMVMATLWRKLQAKGWSYPVLV